MADFLTPISDRDAALMSPVTLAYVGDAVQTLFVRRSLALERDRKPADLQRLAAEKVSAIGQNELLVRIEGVFSEEETAIYRRGRNAKKASKAKNATPEEYNRSTGVEAVIGYLFLTGRYDRIEELLSL